MHRVWLFWLAGCNQVFGLEQTAQERLVEPAPAASCSGVVPAFDSWTYARKAFPDYPYGASNSLQNVSFYGADGAIVGDGNHVFDLAGVTSAGGTLTAIPSLSPTDGTTIVALASSPRGEVLWFARGGSTAPGHYFSAAFYAIRARSWELHSADLAIPGAPIIAWPTSVASYAGTNRMTVIVEDLTGTPFRLVELTSDDGDRWSDTHTLDGFVDAGSPYLSADGCTFMFTRNAPSTTYPKLYAAARDDATGRFGGEVMLATAPAQDVYSQNPALDATNRRLWYFHSFAEAPSYDHAIVAGEAP